MNYYLNEVSIEHTRKLEKCPAWSIDFSRALRCGFYTRSLDTRNSIIEYKSNSQ